MFVLSQIQFSKSRAWTHRWVAIRTFQRSSAAEGGYVKVRRGSKSMEHNVDNLCKHKMLRWAAFLLDQAFDKGNQPISRDIFVIYWYIRLFLIEKSMKNVLTMVAVASYPLPPHTTCCGRVVRVSPHPPWSKSQSLFSRGLCNLCSVFSSIIIRERL